MLKLRYISWWEENKMQELELVRKIEDKAREWKINPKDKKFLLKGQELQESLELINKDNIRFMLRREIELIKTSRRYQYFKKFKMKIILIILTVIAGVVYFLKFFEI